MKKLVLIGLCTALCLQITACGGLGKADNGLAVNGTAATSNEKSGVSISDKLESGELLIDGVKYSFPSAISDWTNNGWHISRNYENINTFTLENNVESTQFEVFSDERDSEYVRMCAINFESDPKKIEEATVSYLSVNVFDGKKSLEVILPGGINCKSTKEDVVNAYGEPQEEDSESLCYYYTNSDGLDIVVEIFILSDKVTRVSYGLADSNWGSVTNAEECVQFINDALKASFYGEFDTYVENKFDTMEGAQELYDSEVDYYAQNLMYFLDIDSQTVDEGILTGFYDVSKAILAKFKWDDPVVDLDDGALRGSFEITMYPTNFVDIIIDDIQAVAESGLEGDEYAQGMLDAVSAKVDEISYREPIIKSYRIDLEDGIVEQEAWDEIDDILMDFAE
ncbi:MAG: hypothetical protein K2N44_12625 [Lachnospiraceae bacterium]|nr:hypothetical protein [Lachnospiraceae bacterium]